MTDTRNETVSVVERTHSVAASGPVIAAHFLGRTAVFVLAEEAMVLAAPLGEPKIVKVHDGVILATTMAIQSSSRAATTAKSSRPTSAAKAAP